HRTGRRRAEGGAEEVVAHGEVLGVVPHARDRVAVVVVHDVTGLARLTVRVVPGRRADGGRELVHLPAVERLLLVVVVVVLITEQHVVDVGRVEPAGIGLVPLPVFVRVVGQERPLTVHPGRVVQPGDLGPAGALERLATGVRGVRIGAEVVIERHVLLEDHDNVLNGRRGPDDAVVRGPAGAPGGSGRRC